VTVINSILRDNDGTAGNQEGGAGAIFVHETTLIVQDSLFTNNRGVNGGAINNLLSNLFVSGSTFTNNTATGYGGAIYTDGASWPTNDAIGGQLVIRTSTFNNNQASGQGGGAFLFAYPPDTITVDGVAFVGNTVSKDAKGDALGGGLRVGNGDFSISNTTFSANIARSQGGGLWRGELGRGTLTNVTFAGNQAVEDVATGKGGLGGAISGGNWSCEHCTIANNHAGFQGGAIWGMGPSITLKQTIVANNTAFNDGQGWNVKNNCGSYPPAYATNGGNNFEFPQRNQGDASDLNCVAGISVADPQLGPLASNGGSVQTMALPIGSPALNIGTNCVATDARGIPRPQGTGCDAGAYELVERLTLNPEIVFAGDPGFTLIIHGNGFSPTSQAIIGGVAHQSVLIDPVTIRVTITANEIATAGDLLVTISNSALPGATLRVLPLATRIYLPLVQRP
jgi:predicted outer membrane repeat protein